MNTTKKTLMKIMIMTVLSLTFVCGGCKKDKGPKWQEAEFEMIFSPNTENRKVSFVATVNGKITIDWGDDSIEEFTVNEVPDFFEHTYDIVNFKTISVKANGLQHFYFGGEAVAKWYGILERIKLKNCPDLNLLCCNHGSLEELDLSNCPALKYLNCGNNRLTLLNVAKNSKLDILECGNNKLMSLNLQNNEKLTYLSCGSNQLTSLDVDNNIILKSLYCGNNLLTSLDVSNNKALRNCSCTKNLLSSEELNSLFNDLPITQPISNSYAEICFYDNPGSEDCDATIATKKGWQVIDKPAWLK